MENINIAELLKDCPEGMELDCVMFEKPVKYMGLTNSGTYIKIKTSCDGVFYLTKAGYLHNMADSKCIIFPKGSTTWEGFQGPFKDGDVVATRDSTWIGITTGGEKERLIPTYCVIKSSGKFEVYFDKKERWAFNRCATEEEKAKLFQAIKDNGYKWNAETKTLEKLIKPKFKVGDRIKYKNGKNIDGVEQGIILSITDDTYDVIVSSSMGIFVAIVDQDNWELAPNKFDITTLIPFESRVLVRDFNSDRWKVSFWGCLADDCDSFKYDTTRGYYKQCIPYEGNEHLLGKADDCIDFYKNWE